MKRKLERKSCRLPVSHWAFRAKTTGSQHPLPPKLLEAENEVIVACILPVYSTHGQIAHFEMQDNWAIGLEPISSTAEKDYGALR